MAYAERDDRDLELSQQSDFNEEELYSELYEPDSFGERVDSGNDMEEAIEYEDSDFETMEISEPTSRVEQGFGEAINPETNPHLDDQLEDEQLQDEAEAEYPLSQQDETE
jgi:hypothetical protein